MATKTEALIQVWLQLSASERDEVYHWLDNFQRADYLKSRELLESIQRKANLGPLSSTICPLCGK